jgi:predicted metal-dependent hydrolase
MKKESLLVLNRSIPYTIRVSERAKRLRIAVYADGDVIVTKPTDTSMAKLRLFVESRKHWIINKLDQKKNPAIKELAEGSDEHFNAHKLEAERLVQRGLDQWSKSSGFTYSSFEIKKHKSRWGSCSKNNNLSFNYKIQFLPKDLQDYIIVHELCHTSRKDHSKYFWAIVAKYLPDYTKLRIKIRTL